MLVVFLGRSVEGILADAKKAFAKEERVLVVSRDGDQLQPPEGLEVVPVSKFTPIVGESYTLIANGGTTGQLLPVLKRLVDSEASVEAWDLQREGKIQVW